MSRSRVQATTRDAPAFMADRVPGPFAIPPARSTGRCPATVIAVGRNKPDPGLAFDLRNVYRLRRREQTHRGPPVEPLPIDSLPPTRVPLCPWRGLRGCVHGAG